MVIALIKGSEANQNRPGVRMEWVLHGLMRTTFPVKADDHGIKGRCWSLA